MITFWIPKLGYDTTYFGKDAHKSFIHHLYNDLNLDHNTKIIYEDKIDPQDNNIFLIIDNHHKYSLIESEKWKIYKSKILWCVENGIKVYFDRAWEHYDKSSLLFPMLTNTVKSLDNVKDVNFFPKYMSSLDPNAYNLNYKSSIKKYDYSVLFGDIRKPHRIMLLAFLESNNLLGNAFYSKFSSRDNWKTPYTYHDPYILNNLNSLLSDRIYGDIYLKNGDKRLPDEYHQSYFDIVTESTPIEIFYTEKTYKPIMTKTPFIIHGATNQNKILRLYHGFEIFEEIFNYDFEDKEDLNIRTNLLGVEIKRLISEPKSIFTQPSVIEKLNHNYDNYKKITSKTFIEKEMEYIL